MISIKGLDLSKDFRIVNIENFDFNYENDKKILNKLILNKNGSNFNIKGESFDFIPVKKLAWPGRPTVCQD